MVIAFTPFELDLVACELRHAGRVVPIQPRVFDTLRYLIEHRDRVVSQQELLDVLWDGQQLNSAAVPWAISRARKALQQPPGQQTFIQTIPKRGYRFVAPLGATEEPPPAPNQSPGSKGTPQTPFVGRTRVIEQLTSALSAASDGRGSLALLTGEAGLGKTRCTTELEALARLRGIGTWVGRCIDHGAAPACWPFIQILRAACADVTLAAGVRDEMQRLLEQLDPSGPEPQRQSEEPARLRFLDRIARTLASAAQDTRLIVIDDLHCADESSLRALGLLEPMLATSRVLVLATARDFGAGIHDAAELVARLRPAHAITLAALTEDDIASYLQAALGQPATAEYTRAVHLRTGGNPLFVSEAVRTALERWDGERALRAEDVPVPLAAREFVSQRLSQLEGPVRDVLATASVIGTEFGLSLLQRTCELRSLPLLTMLNDALVARILEPSDARSYRFSHPLLREVVYNELSVARRAELHARVGLALEALAAIDASVQQLAFHFHRALDSDFAPRAARYAELAGDAAMRVYAYEEAATFYAWALDAHAALPTQEPAALGKMLLKHAAALARGGAQEEARTRCARAIALAREHQLPEILVGAARLLRPSNAAAQVPHPVALAALEEALASLPESATAARVRTYAQLACIPPYAYRLEESKRLSDEGLRLARACGDRGLELEALGARLYSLSGPDTPDELLALTDQLLDAEREPDSWLISDAHIARYLTFLSLGRAEQADNALRTFGKEAQALRVKAWAWHHQRFFAHRTLDGGLIDEAEQRFEQLWVDGQALGLSYAAAIRSAQSIALEMVRTGHVSALNPLADPVWHWARQIPFYRALRIARAIGQGERLQARQSFDELMQDQCAAVNRDYAFLGTLAKLAQAAIALSDLGAARTLAALLTPYASRIAITDFGISFGAVSQHLGMLAGFLGDHAQARERFEQAQQVNAATGHKLLAMRSRTSLAQLLLETGTSKHDRARARALALEVKDEAHQCGAGSLQQAAEQLLELSSPAAMARPSRDLSA